MNNFFEKDGNFVGAKGLVYIGDKILVYRRDAKAPKYPLCLDVPGGGAEPGETPFETFRREVKEEFGLDIARERVVYSKRYQSSLKPNEFGWYAVAKLPQDVEGHIQFGDEGLEYLLMPLDEFLKRDDAWPAYQIRAADYLKSTQYELEHRLPLDIDGKQLEDVEAIKQIVKALEKKYPTHNDAFAYGTRLCEETGELIEALAAYDTDTGDSEHRLHLVKELQDVLRLVIGILGIYNKFSVLPMNLRSVKAEEHGNVHELIVELAVYAGHLANAINHAQNAGSKRTKLGGDAESRLAEKATALVSVIVSAINYYQLSSDMDDEIVAAYQRFKQQGYITAQ